MTTQRTSRNAASLPQRVVAIGSPALLLKPWIVFPALWVLAAGLAQIPLLSQQRAWSTAMVAVAVVVPLAFLTGSAMGAALATRVAPLATKAPPAALARTSTLRRCLLVLLLVGYAELVGRFVVAGTVPLLAGNIDEARFSLPGGPHVVLRDALTIVAIIGLSFPKRLAARESRFEVGLAVAALAGFALEGGRTPVVLPIVVAVAVRAVYWGMPSARSLLVLAVALLTAFSVLFYVRTAQHSSNAFESEFYRDIVPSTPFLLRPLLPVVVALSTNFLALAAVVDHFPSVEPFAHGAFSAYGYDLFIPNARELGAVSAQISPPWTVSTAAGQLWADGGLLVVAFGMAAIGALTTGLVVAGQRTRRYSESLLAGFAFFLAVFCVYQNLLTQQPDWLIVGPGIYLLGAVAEGRLTAASVRRKIRPIVIGVAGAVLALVAVAVVVTAISPSPSSPTIAPLPVSETSVVRAGPGITAAETDGDLRTAAPLWVLSRDGSSAQIRSYDPTDGRRLSAHLVGESTLAGARTFDVSNWPASGSGTTPALFTFRVRGDLLTTTAVSIAGAQQRLAQGTAVVSRPPTGWIRDISVARSDASDERPDVFVIDRDPGTTGITVTVISGASGYRGIALRDQRPLGVQGSVWSFDVSHATSGASADLMGWKVDPSNPHSELHLAAAPFDSFSYERELAVPSRLPAGTRILSGATGGRPAAYLIEPAGADGRLNISVVPLQVG